MSEGRPSNFLPRRLRERKLHAGAFAAGRAGSRALSRGALSAPLHSRLNKTALFSDCCCTTRWIAATLSRASAKLLLPLPRSSRVGRSSRAVAPVTSLCLSLLQSRRLLQPRQALLLAPAALSQLLWLSLAAPLSSCELRPRPKAALSQGSQAPASSLATSATAPLGGAGSRWRGLPGRRGPAPLPPAPRLGGRSSERELACLAACEAVSKARRLAPRLQAPGSPAEAARRAPPRPSAARRSLALAP